VGQNSCHILLCGQQVCTVRRRGWEGSADSEVVCCGNGEAREKDKGKEVGKGEFEVWTGGRERRKKIMKRGIECTSLLGCGAVRWASTAAVLLLHHQELS